MNSWLIAQRQTHDCWPTFLPQNPFNRFSPRYFLRLFRCLTLQGRLASAFAFSCQAVLLRSSLLAMEMLCILILCNCTSLKRNAYACIVFSAALIKFTVHFLELTDSHLKAAWTQQACLAKAGQCVSTLHLGTNKCTLKLLTRNLGSNHNYLDWLRIPMELLCYLHRLSHSSSKETRTRNFASDTSKQVKQGWMSSVSAQSWPLLL